MLAQPEAGVAEPARQMKKWLRWSAKPEFCTQQINGDIIRLNIIIFDICNIIEILLEPQLCMETGDCKEVQQVPNDLPPCRSI